MHAAAGFLEEKKVRLIDHTEPRVVSDPEAPLKMVDVGIATVRQPSQHGWCLVCFAGRQDFCIAGDFIECGITCPLKSKEQNHDGCKA